MKETFINNQKLKILVFFLFLTTFCWGTVLAQITVSGSIKNSEDEPLIGVAIKIKDSTVGTISDMDGNYLIKVPNSNSILEFSYLGFIKQEITVGNSTTIDVVMLEDTRLLDEVVVVGYGVQKKVNVTGSVSSIDFEDQASSRPITSISASLSGLSAGLNASQTSGQPGKNGATLRVRGVSTMNNNSPLVLIDGMVGSIDDLNPNDISSISILKDGSSTAIYGARAGAGVILVTTKSGNRTGKLTVNYSGRISIMNPTNLPKIVTNYADHMNYMNEAFEQAGVDPVFKQETIDLWREKAKDPHGLTDAGYPNYVAYPNTDWMEEAYNDNQILQEHNVSITGASEKTRFLMSLGYMNNPGIVDYSGMERYNIRINLETDINKWWTIGTRTYGNKDNRGRLIFDDPDDDIKSLAINNWIMGSTPGAYPKYDGLYGGPEALEENQSVNNIRRRLESYSNGKLDYTRFNTTLYSTIKFMEGLTWTANLNYDRTWNETKSWTNPATGGAYSFSRNTAINIDTPSNEMTVSNDREDYYSYTLEHLLNFNKSFGNHDVTALLGYQEYYAKYWTNGATSKGMIDESIPDMSSTTEVRNAYGNTYDNASRSIFGRATYAYKSRYLAEFNIRHDGHSRFHKNQRWGTFPSFAVGWRISEEAFMQNTKDWLDNLKFRFSWGKSGNYGGDGADWAYNYQGGYSTKKYSLNNIQQMGLVQNMIANAALKWEVSKTYNFGIDANFFDQRLSFEFDAYHKKTDGILRRVSIPLTAGSKTEPMVNLAELKNNGFELTLGWQDRIRDFSYGITTNLGYSKNKVNKYKGYLTQGWVQNAEGEMVWTTNLGDVAEGSTELTLENHTYQEYFLRQTYSGSGNYFDSNGNVNPDGGPRDGMIRTEEDMKWAKAMADAGFKFQGFENVGTKTGLYYGDYFYQDINGDGIYGNDADRKFYGSSSIPKYTYGIQLQAAWKGFDVFLNFAGAAGFDLLWAPKQGYNSTTQITFGNAISSDVAYNHYFYDPANPSDPRTNINAKYPRISNIDTSTTYFSSNYNLYKGDYLKLKNLTIGYTLPESLTQKININKIRINFSGENLFCIDNFPGVDPEQGALPYYQPIKQYSFGINVTF